MTTWTKDHVNTDLSVDYSWLNELTRISWGPRRLFSHVSRREKTDVNVKTNDLFILTFFVSDEDRASVENLNPTKSHQVLQNLTGQKFGSMVFWISDNNHGIKKRRLGFSTRRYLMFSIIIMYRPFTLSRGQSPSLTTSNLKVTTSRLNLSWIQFSLQFHFISAASLSFLSQIPASDLYLPASGSSTADGEDVGRLGSVWQLIGHVHQPCQRDTLNPVYQQGYIALQLSVYSFVCLW